jgi:aspartyl-tRNA(Asn)/glutamyl-tRNA(Gln) amidotransferase subunit C
MGFTVDDVRHVAVLAKLAFSDGELEAFTLEMNAILGFVGKLREVDIAGVEPAFRVPRRENVLRSDVVHEMLSQDDALSNAPDRDAGFFRVPGFLLED